MCTQFIEKYRRNYINYAALVDVCFTGSDEMNEEWELLTDEERSYIIKCVKEWINKYV